MRTRRLLIALTLSLGLTVAFLWPLGVGLTPGAHALTLIGVDSTADTVADDEACTLREAIINANNDDQSGSTDCPAGSGADTILLPAGTYALSISGAGENGAASGDLDITDDLTIVGAGAASTIIDANGLDRVIDLPLAATVAISGVTLSNGAANFGGGLSLGSGGVVTLVNSVVSDNASTNFIGGGGGIYNAGGTLTLDRTTVRNNTTSGSNGAGIENVFGATLTVNDSTISGNIGASSSVGGGINNFQATTFLNNSTVSGNTAALGHNVNNWGDAGQTVMVVNHSTIRAITGTALSTISGGGAVTTTLNHTLIAKSGLGLACSTTGGGVVVSTGYNLATDFSCNLNHITDKPSSNPLLGPLQNNGGGTETHALLSGSLAIGAGDPGFSPPPAFDQRGPGFPRVQGGVIDIGAFESNLLPQADLSLTKSVNNVSPEVGDRVRFTLTVFNGGPNPATNVEVTDLLPAGLSYDAHLASQGVYSPATGLWDVGALSASFARLEITATANSASALTNVAEITASDLPDPDSTPGNGVPSEDDQDSATVTGIVLEADLALSKTDTPDPVQAGTSLTYTLALTNGGPAAALGLVVTDVVPLEVSILSAGIGPEGSCQTLGRAVTCTTGLKILLVDDDDDFPDVRGFYTRALEALGQTYTVFDVPGQTANGPDAATMSAYDLVIWFSGDQCCGGGEFEESGLPAAGPTEADELALATYLRNGGKLFLSSQDYHFDQGDITTTFMVDFLGVNDIVSDVESTSPISGVLDFAGLGPYPLDYLTPGLEAFPDDITPNSNGSVAFVAAGGQNLAANTGNTVFFAFPWEAIQNAGDRQASLQAIIDHLTGGFGSLAPGQSRLITIATAVDPEASGLIVNTAAAASGTPDPDPAGNFASEGTTVNPPDPPQSGATLTVNTAADADDGACSLAHCSLREAISAANATLGLQETIAFNIPGAGPHTIQPNFALPTLTDPLIIDGTTQPQGAVELDGGGSEASMNGLTLDTGDSTVRGLVIRNFDGDGVRVLSGPGNTGNAITANRIFNNTGLAIDLGGDGVTPNDAGDADSGPNNLQNFPVLQRAIPAGSSTNIEGLLNSTPETVFNLEFFANPACDPSGFGQGQTFLGAISATTDLAGTARFTGTLPAATTNGQFVTATATDPSGNTSEFSPCITAGPPNDSWVRALELTLVPGSPLQATVEQHVDQPDQSRWFKFRVQPNSQVIVTLTGLPENYDLTLYKDIAVTFEELIAPQDENDLNRLGAEFAPAAFSPAAFSPAAFSPAAFSPAAFSPDAFSPAAFSPAAFSPAAFSPAAFSSAQLRSLIGVSAFEGTASEGIIVNTWNNNGFFYVRVRGRDGVFSLDAPFRLTVVMLTGACNNIQPLPDTSPLVPPGNQRTLILTDLSRTRSTSPVLMGGTGAEKDALEARLQTLAARPEVDGLVVDVSQDPRVVFANAQADANPECPFAKNLVAEAIKDIVDGYRAQNGSSSDLEYVVLIGGDDIIPFFRYPDTTLLGNEQNYVPPVLDFTASQASLRLGYVLSQDAYGARTGISLNANTFPIPDLAVGRLVETAPEISGMIDAYLQGTDGGVVPTPTSSLVTGYDFLEDAANAVQTELEAGIGAPADTLITPNDLPPELGWTATDLGAQLLGSRHDIVFLAGHFSANSALAADYRSSLVTTDLVASPVDMTNAIIFSAGCHSGYNIVNQHGVPGVTLQLDWAQAFAQKRATLIAGTGYQYGDTDFLEYSERIYAEFSRQLRVGSGPVSVGNALVAAKQIYLKETPDIRGLHEKALLEATIFGLPMLSVDLPPEGRLPAERDESIVGATTAFETDPGDTLGLEFADIVLPLAGSLVENTVELVNVDNPSQSVQATYYTGPDGVVTNPAEPALPLVVENVAVQNTSLRGVGFRGGTYTDIPDIIPLTGAPTTEIRGVHSPFLSDVFHRIRTWYVNYWEALIGGDTRLMVTPVQHRSTSPGSQTSTLRRFDEMVFRLYYSDNVETFVSGGVASTPALSAPPSISGVGAVPDNGNLRFGVRVVGNPAAGIQEVWVTYTTACPSPLTSPCTRTWQSLDLSQNPSDSTLWTGTLNLNGTAPEDIRFIVQAVNGVGLVALADNLGAFYTPRSGPGVPAVPTNLVFDPPLPPDASGAYSTQATFSARLTRASDGAPLGGRAVLFGLGPASRVAVTGPDGRASITMPLVALPDQYEVSATFLGAAGLEPSSTAAPFEITFQDTALSLQTASGPGQPLAVATLTDVDGRRLIEESILFVVTGPDGTHTASIITDVTGQAILNTAPLPVGTYTIRAFFGGEIVAPNGQTVILLSDTYRPSSATETLNVTSSNGKIRIVEKIIGGDTSQVFDFSGDLNGFSLGNNQIKTFDDLPPGDYDVTQALPPDRRLKIVCLGGEGTPIADGVTIRLELGGRVNCIFVNQVAGQITVAKEASLTHPFRFNGDLGQFTLTSQSAASQMTFSNLEPGVYTVAEDAASFPPGLWALLDVTCVDAAHPGQPVEVVEDLGNHLARISLAAGQHLICTFFNEAATFEGETYQYYFPIVIKGVAQ